MDMLRFLSDMIDNEYKLFGKNSSNEVQNMLVPTAKLNYLVINGKAYAKCTDK